MVSIVVLYQGIHVIVIKQNSINVTRTCIVLSPPPTPQSFTLEFHFEPNGYFNNAVLTKVYKMKSEPDPSDPFSFEGPEIIDCEG